ncbi:DeoR/GlpR family DNA-binding transcription regulator [Ruoffia tabacinasalis]|uniref:Lactose phosphotransferase system repressor n=1 Tax=Ruoffia tabacinasalis TaxID=87458 RepID=A0ABS0LIA1_9LACT|nr:DeoR/GlpR family DNA-binding transcription regulator [Ruoffia tabacinasalis]MBG9977787.1 DeoR/GlpR transcriptional regulator [Ruoffia tabacinasalis]
MLKNERQQEIIDILEVSKKVITKELVSHFNVSEDTIRRDLKELEDLNRLKRVYSGAVRVGPAVTDFNYRTTVNLEEKNEMALSALEYLKEDSIILIDGSTSNLALARMIPNEFKATVITNSPPIAIELSNHPNINVINIGGEYYKRSMINIGVSAFQQINKVRADLYVMGVYNIDPDVGSSVPTLAEAEIKQAMVSVSTEVLSMVTPDKFDTVSNYIVGDYDEITYLITTTGEK